RVREVAMDEVSAKEVRPLPLRFPKYSVNEPPRLSRPLWPPCRIGNEKDAGRHRMSCFCAPQSQRLAELVCRNRVCSALPAQKFDKPNRNFLLKATKKPFFHKPKAPRRANWQLNKPMPEQCSRLCRTSRLLNCFICLHDFRRATDQNRQ